MNNKTHNKVLLRVLVALLAVTLLFGIFAAPQAEAANYKASYIELMENDLKLNISDYFDSSVAYQLPESVKDDQEISVIITMSIDDLMDSYEKTDKSVSFKEYALQGAAAKEIEAQVAEKKTEVLEELDQLAIGYDIGEDYSVLLTGFSIVIRAGDFKALCKSLDSSMGVIVGEVYQAAETQLVENKVSVYDTGITDGSVVKYDGSGTTVAVLDTGIDYAHSAFSVENFTSTHLGMTYEDVAALLSSTLASKQYAGLTVDDVYVSEKIPFMFDYADQDPDAYSTHNTHGTHVSGIILGKDDTITGVAPNAQLLTMKVFSDLKDGAQTEWILSALEDCVILGVDAINMSLGQSSGFSRPEDEYAVSGIFDKIRDAGISLITAGNNDNHSGQGSTKNGNLPLTSNPDVGTVGSPATYEASLAVASIQGVKTPYIKHGDRIIYFNESNTNAGKENHFFDDLLGDASAKEFEFVVIPGVGRTADYTGLDVKGKIALVRRGDTTFEEKAVVAQNQGAVGCIIYNNVAGDIRMNSGDATLALCSINQDDGEYLAATKGGTIAIDKSQTSGPFMDDFSSWGPTPSLEIKPEITQHGGNILSAVTGGDYDRLSGTSMACPNMCGVALLLRQYIVENFPDIANDPVEVNNMVNRLSMSTADIMNNKNGQPYAVRKQGAGLANLLDAVNTKAVILTYDKDGNVMTKTKLELGDDKAKTGVYEMTFAVQNFGTNSLSYDVGAHILTEGVSETLTSHGETTVTQMAYPLEGAVLEITNIEGGTKNGMNITVNGGNTAKVTVKITLSDADKKYMDDSFENGMYVEGFITLTATAGTEVNMNVPYLAFYGDWTVAPQQDLDYFQTDADDRDNSKLPEDKVMADGWATMPIAGLYDDYITAMGSYYFMQNPDDMVIAANKEHIALSNTVGSAHSIRYIYAGMLRGAAKVVITITDDITGEVIFTRVEDYVRKGRGDSPSLVEVEFNVEEYNLKNNSTYTVRMESYLDYKDDGKDTNKRNVFEFPLTIDYQAPAVHDVEFYYEYDKTLKKNRLYADVAVYDNHHAMALQLGYISKMTNEDGTESAQLNAFSNYLTPVYSQRNGTTIVKLELTDYIEEIRNNCYTENNEIAFVLTAYDYAMNTATYEIGMPYNYVDFFMDGLTDNTLTMSPNEVYNMMPSVYPNTQWGELLEISTMDENVAGVVNNKIIARSSGTTLVKMQDPLTKEFKTFTLKVLAEGDEGYKVYDKPAVEQFTMLGYETLKAYYRVSTEDREIGETGNQRYFNGDYSLSMFPSESVKLNYDLRAYFPKDVKVEFTAGNSNIVTIDENGVVTAVAEGFSSVTAKVYMDGKATYYTQTISVAVKDPYIVLSGMLQNYFGLGGVVEIPERLGLSSIYTFAFSNYSWEMKTPEELAKDDSWDTIQRPIGENTITKVIIPEGVETIYEHAFAKLTALEEVVLPSTLKHIDQYAFDGCVNLKKITFSGENNLKIINNSAFRNCDLEGNLDLSSAYVISDYAFFGNEDLTSVSLPETLQTIGSYAFAGCEKLSQVNITASKVKFGAYAFTGCESLTSFYVNTSLIPAGLFYKCKNLSDLTIGPDVNAINEFAFNGTNISTFNVEAGNTAFLVQSADYVVSADGSQLIAVAPNLRGKVTASNFGSNNITSIGRGAFSHNLRVTSVNLPNVTSVGPYAFGFYDASEPTVRSALASVTLGELTNIGEYAFFGINITELPRFNAKTTIGKYAFANSGITAVEIPDGMTLPEGMFAECPKLTTVVIGDDVTIGDFAFITNRNYNLRAQTWQEDGKTYAQYLFDSPITKVTIGNNVVIGKGAFQNAAALNSVALGENVQIGEQAFYNCEALVDIDLSKVKSVGSQAFAGDTYYICTDQTMTTPVVKDGRYQIQYTACGMTSVDLSSAESIGSYAFAFCRNLVSVKLSETITVVPEYAFYSCIALTDINLDKIETIDQFAFYETALTSADLSNVTKIGDYAFMNSSALSSVVLNTNGTVIEGAAFANCFELTEMQNMEYVTEVGDNAFAYSGLTEADLTSAVKIGINAFIKHPYVCEKCGHRAAEKLDECPNAECGEKSPLVAKLAPFSVKLGNNLVELGDNPFAYCLLTPFSSMDTVTINGNEYSTEIFTYQVSETVYVVDGNLYCEAPNGGLVMITYTGRNADNVMVADGTVRISAYAFAGTDVKMSTLPHTVGSIGHKAFYGCQDLQIIVFTSYEAPILEEEYDPNYYNSMQNLPGTGEYGGYKDYEGNDFTLGTLEIIPYYMWNLSEQIVYYGANFVDYIGHIDNKILMVRPTNGQHYGTFIHEQYFNHVIDGDVAAQDATLAAIAAISKIPERVMWEHRDIVAAAREAYNKVATKDQQALIANYNGVDYYSILDKAEQRIKKQKPCDCGMECGCEIGSGCVCGESCCDACGCMPVDPVVEPDNTVDSWKIIAIVALCLVAVAGIVIVVLAVRMRKPADVAEEIPAAEVAAEETQVEEEAPAEPETEETSETE